MNNLNRASCIRYLLPRNITLFTFDFAGCGKSEGQFISLGYHQRYDVQTVFQHLRSLQSVSSIGIWGRSMGAVTALMYSRMNPQIGCLVLDSPFSSLQVLCKQLAAQYLGSGASFLLAPIAFKMLQSTVQQKNNFRLSQVNPIDQVKQSFIPALFIAAKSDNFIVPRHSQDLKKAYAGDTDLIIVDGDHNSPRQMQIQERISNFFYYNLQVQQLVPEFNSNQKENKQSTQQFQKQGTYIYATENNDYDDDQDDEILKLALALSLQETQKLQNNKKSSQDLPPQL